MGPKKPTIESQLNFSDVNLDDMLAETLDEVVEESKNAEDSKVIAGEDLKLGKEKEEIKGKFSEKHPFLALTAKMGASILGTYTGTRVFGMAFMDIKKRSEVVKERGEAQECLEKMIEIAIKRKQERVKDREENKKLSAEEIKESGGHKELVEAVKNFKQSIEEAKYLPEFEKKDLRKELAKIIREHRKSEKNIDEEEAKNVEKTTKQYIKHKINKGAYFGEGLNTFCALTPLAPYRILGFAAGATWSRLEKMSIEKQERIKKGEIEEQIKINFFGGFTEAWHGIWDKQKSGKERAMNELKFAGGVLRVAGLIGLGNRSMIDFGGKEALYGRFLDQIKETCTAEGLWEKVKIGAGKMSDNFFENLNRVTFGLSGKAEKAVVDVAGLKSGTGEYMSPTDFAEEIKKIDITKIHELDKAINNVDLTGGIDNQELNNLVENVFDGDESSKQLLRLVAKYPNEYGVSPEKVETALVEAKKILTETASRSAKEALDSQKIEELLKAHEGAKGISEDLQVAGQKYETAVANVIDKFKTENAKEIQDLVYKGNQLKIFYTDVAGNPKEELIDISQWNKETGLGSVWGHLKEKLIEKSGGDPEKIPSDLKILGVGRGKGVADPDYLKHIVKEPAGHTAQAGEHAFSGGEKFEAPKPVVELMTGENVKDTADTGVITESGKPEFWEPAGGWKDQGGVNMAMQDLEEGGKIIYYDTNKDGILDHIRALDANGKIIDEAEITGNDIEKSVEVFIDDAKQRLGGSGEQLKPVYEMLKEKFSDEDIDAIGNPLDKTSLADLQTKYNWVSHEGKINFSEGENFGEDKTIIFADTDKSEIPDYFIIKNNHGEIIYTSEHIKVDNPDEYLKVLDNAKNQADIFITRREILLDKLSDGGVKQDIIKRVGVDPWVKDFDTDPVYIKKLIFLQHCAQEPQGFRVDDGVETINLIEKSGANIEDYKIGLKYLDQLRDFQNDHGKIEGYVNLAENKGNAKDALSKLFNTTVTDKNYEFKHGEHIITGVEKKFDIHVKVENDKILFGADRKGVLGGNWGKNGKSLLFRTDANLTNDNIGKANEFMGIKEQTLLLHKEVAGVKIKDNVSEQFLVREMAEKKIEQINFFKAKTVEIKRLLSEYYDKYGTRPEYNEFKLKVMNAIDQSEKEIQGIQNGIERPVLQQAGGKISPEYFAKSIVENAAAQTKLIILQEGRNSAFDELKFEELK